MDGIGVSNNPVRAVTSFTDVLVVGSLQFPGVGFPVNRCFCQASARPSMRDRAIEPSTGFSLVEARVGGGESSEEVKSALTMPITWSAGFA